MDGPALLLGWRPLAGGRKKGTGSASPRAAPREEEGKKKKKKGGGKKKERDGSCFSIAFAAASSEKEKRTSGASASGAGAGEREKKKKAANPYEALRGHPCRPKRGEELRSDATIFRRALRKREREDKKGGGGERGMASSFFLVTIQRSVNPSGRGERKMKRTSFLSLASDWKKKKRKKKKGHLHSLLFWPPYKGGERGKKNDIHPSPHQEKGRREEEEEGGEGDVFATVMCGKQRIAQGEGGTSFALHEEKGEREEVRLDASVNDAPGLGRKKTEWPSRTQGKEMREKRKKEEGEGGMPVNFIRAIVRPREEGTDRSKHGSAITGKRGREGKRGGGVDLPFQVLQIAIGRGGKGDVPVQTEGREKERGE